eukprot:TRINITY_DN1198_c0_g2_i2.p1 TRINITY_DN1198_c0_g2~~TRINITY_DN1198_c0_g2_i2.p1  ORF type:complete len:109 (+),score=26.29 TRINITY_DN1198_c0_g2_i2:128-454(+)
MISGYNSFRDQVCKNRPRTTATVSLFHLSEVILDLCWGQLNEFLIFLDNTNLNVVLIEGTLETLLEGQNCCVNSILNLHLPVLCVDTCLLYTSPSPRDRTRSRMPSSA